MNDSELKGTKLGELRGRLWWSNTQDALVVIYPLHPLFQFFFCPHLLFFFSRLWLMMVGDSAELGGSSPSCSPCFPPSALPHLGLPPPTPPPKAASSTQMIRCCLLSLSGFSPPVKTALQSPSVSDHPCFLLHPSSSSSSS